MYFGQLVKQCLNRIHVSNLLGLLHGAERELMKLNLTTFFVALTLLMVIGEVQASSRVLIRYFYYGSSNCPDCAPENERITLVLTEIMSLYGDQVYVMRVDLSYGPGRDMWMGLNLTEVPVMVITYDNEQVVLEEITKENLEAVIDAFLGDKPPPSEPNHVSAYSLFAAFSLGFFDTFSPCLITLLSFILSYTIGKTSRFKEGFLRVVTFGIGFIVAAILLGATVAFTVIFMPSIQSILMWIVSVFAILLGLSLLGLLNVPIQTRTMVEKLAGKYAGMYVGLLLLGFIFYFLDPCIAPFAFTMLMMLQNFEYTLPLMMFCVGAMIPFVGIGILAGYASKLARSAYKHRSKIRAISGLILIIYALYLIIFYLL